MSEFLLHTAWITLSMSFIILLTLIFMKLFGRRFSAKSRYTVWTVVMLSLCLSIGLYKLPSLFTVEFSMPSLVEKVPDLQNYDLTDKMVKSNTTPTLTDTLPDTDDSDTKLTEIDKIEIVTLDIPIIIFCIWITGAVVFFTCGFVVYIRTTHRYARGKNLCHTETEEVFRNLCRRYNIKHIPHLYVCTYVESPVLYGYTNPTILLPNIYLAENSLVGVLSHELIHYRRGDIYMKLTCLIVQSLYWFNPLVYIAVMRCNAEMELSCDEEVLLGMDEDSRRSYGNVMLDIVKNYSQKISMLTSQYSPQKKAVQERLVNILDTTKKKKGRGIIVLTAVTCIISGAGVGFSYNYENNSNEINDKSRHNTNVEKEHSYYTIPVSSDPVGGESQTIATRITEMLDIIKAQISTLDDRRNILYTEKVKLIENLDFLHFEKSELIDRLSLLNSEELEIYDQLNFLDAEKSMIYDRLNLIDTEKSGLNDRLDLLNSEESWIYDRLNVLNAEKSELNDRLNIVVPKEANH